MYRCAESGAALPPEVIDRLARDPHPSVRANAARLPGESAQQLAALLQIHREPDRLMPVEMFEELSDYANHAASAAQQCALTPRLFRRRQIAAGAIGATAWPPIRS